MNNRIIKGALIFFSIIALFVLLGAFLNGTFNGAQWGRASQGFFMICFVVTLICVSAYVFGVDIDEL